MVILKTRWQCRFCAKSFAHENRYLEHSCKLMKRDEEFRTLVGQSAWNYYQHWLKVQRRVAPSPETFLSSKYYNSFIKFARFTHQVQIPDTDLFIKLMKENDIPPGIWTNERVYAKYIEHLDRITLPLKQAKITIETLLHYADEHHIDVSMVFENISPSVVIDLLAKRKLSPWLLLFSNKFKDFYMKRASQEQKLKIDALIRPEYWAKKLKKHSSEAEIIKKYIQELNI